MNKDVLVSVTGVKSNEDEEPVRVVSKGRFYRKGGKTYVKYQQLDFLDNISDCVLMYTENTVEMRKSSVEGRSHMLFEKGRNCKAAYRMPYGTMYVSTNTEEITINESDDLIEIHMEYALDINYVYVADFHIDIRIESEDSDSAH